jgi:hypothetical protein
MDTLWFVQDKFLEGDRCIEAKHNDSDVYPKLIQRLSLRHRVETDFEYIYKIYLKHLAIWSLFFKVLI